MLMASEMTMLNALRNLMMLMTLFTLKTNLVYSISAFGYSFSWTEEVDLLDVATEDKRSNG